MIFIFVGCFFIFGLWSCDLGCNFSSLFHGLVLSIGRGNVYFNFRVSFGLHFQINC